MAEHSTLYSLATYYDIALAHDATGEVQFILDVFTTTCGRSMRSALELASGPGYHARALSKQGVRTLALDLSPQMIDLGKASATAEHLDISWICADMRNFQLDSPVDTAFCMLDGIDCLLEDADMIDHLRAVARALVPGGLYIIELTHPRDCSPSSYGSFRYEGERSGCHVEIEWATNRPVGGPDTRILPVEVTMRVRENGSEQTYTDYAKERFWSKADLENLCLRSGAFTPLASYGDFSLTQGFDNSAQSGRLILVLQAAVR
jgi:SAM-dependent methyltransferase